MAGIFQSGVFSMGFDMAPITPFTINPAGANSNITPYGFGYSWAITTIGTGTGLALNTNLTTLIAGWHYDVGTTLLGTNAIIATWWDVTAGAAQVTLRAYADGHLAFFQGSGTGTQLGSSSAVGILTATNWIFLEAKVVINGSAGSVELRVNGNSTPVITQGSLNTAPTGNNWVSGLLFASASGGTAYIDDIYALDTTGTSPLNTYLGVVQVRGDVPNNNSAVGGRNAWTPTTPTGSNYQNEANIPYNSAEYNASATAGQYDMFRFTALPASVTSVLFMNEWAYIQLDSPGSRVVLLDCYSGGTDVVSSNVSPSVGNPTYYNLVITVDPHTGTTWGVTNASSAELGVKILA